ncbi:MAG: 30S ribosomal protein S5 [Patescibacteria group bacterium]|nr:30S ribosomal protein S5 [Patescibacteria group bacterium]
MTEEKKPQENKKSEIAPATEAKVKAVRPITPARGDSGRAAPAAGAKNNLSSGSGFGERGGDRRKNFKGKRGAPRGRGEGKDEEFEQKMIDIARVTRVMAGGKRMRFRACVAIGNKKGRVAIGLAKGADVTGAVTKAVNKAKKEFTDVPIVNETIPHEIYQKLGAAKILLKPAKKGRGLITGGVVRIILELSGVKNITGKILGTGNKVNNAKCVMEALKNLKRPELKRVKAEKEKPALTTITDLAGQDKK